LVVLLLNFNYKKKVNLAENTVTLELIDDDLVQVFKRSDCRGTNMKRGFRWTILQVLENC